MPVINIGYYYKDFRSFKKIGRLPHERSRPLPEVDMEQLGMWGMPIANIGKHQKNLRTLLKSAP